MGNSYLVYPGHGVGKVTSKKDGFLCLEILSNSLKVKIPESNANSVGLRPLISKEEAIEVVSIMNQSTVSKGRNWNQRYQKAMARVNSGDIKQIAEVYSEIATVEKNKELSFGEKKLKQLCASLINEELQIVETL